MKTATKPKRLSPRKFLDASLFWPHWPMLPLMMLPGKGDTHGEEATGFLFSYSCEPEPVVYFGNIFAISPIAEKLRVETGEQNITWQQMLATMKSRRFASLEEVLEHYCID